MRVIVWVLALATTLPELLSLLPILLPYPLTLEVAKVDFLFSYLSSKLPAPVLSEPLVLHHPSSLKKKVSFAQSCLHAPRLPSATSLCAASVPPASSLVHLTCRHLLGNHGEFPLILTLLH